MLLSNKTLHIKDIGKFSEWLQNIKDITYKYISI